MGTFYNEDEIKQREAAILQGQSKQKGMTVVIIVLLGVALIAFTWWKKTHDPRTMIMDLNKATKDQLVGLPNVGPVTADAIIAGRPYKDVEDLKKIKGIGEKHFENIRPRVKVE